MVLPGHNSHVTFIVNPKAGTKSTSSFANQINRYLDKSQFSYSVHFTQRAGHGFELAREAVNSGVSIVVAVGGDGTMNECARALIKTDSVLGLIPMGSGNGLARDLGISRNVAKSLSIINKYHIRSIDCGTIDGWHFFCTAGIGFDAEVSKKFELQGTRGFAGYVKTAFKELPGYCSAQYHLKFDHSDVVQKAFSITLANACQFGNNAIISPNADPGDGFLDLCIIKDFPKFKAPSLLRRLFSGAIHHSSYCEIHKVREAQIICPENSVYHLDGETRELDGNVLKIGVIPDALQVLVP